MPALVEEPATDEVSSSLEGIDSSVMLQEIRRNCFLLSVVVRRWDGQYMVKGSTVSLERGQLSAELTTSPRWKLVPEAWHKQIQPFASRVRSAVYRVGVSFKDGVYIVPKSKARQLVDEIEEARRAYLDVVRNFLREWPDIKERLRQRITREASEEQWLQLLSRLPDDEKMLGLFDIEVSLWPVGSSGGMSAALLDALDAMKDALRQNNPGLATMSRLAPEHAVAMNLLTTSVSRVLEASEADVSKFAGDNMEAWMEEASQTTNRLVAKAVESMLTEPVEEFARAVNNLQEIQDREGGRCMSGSLEMIRRAHAKLAGFQFMVPDQLIRKLKDVEVRLGSVTPRDVNVGATAARQLTESLQSIRQELEDTDALRQGLGKFTRCLRLDMTAVGK